jgi:two-component system LytT family response regulator
MNTHTASIRVMIVDDEVLARENVKALIRDDPEIQIVAQCSTGTEAIDAIKQHRPDLVFLDIQMPGMTGFDVLENLPASLLPQVVFVTAYDQFALKAFEVRAVDYVLKPFNRVRFAETLARAKVAVRGHEQHTLAKRIEEVIAAMQRLRDWSEPGSPTKAHKGQERLFLRSNGEIYPMTLENILWIEADGDYIRLHGVDKTHYVRMSLLKVMDKLDPAHFVRVHRSTIVNLRRMRKISAAVFGEYTVELTNGMKLKVSRTYVKNLKAHF